MSETIYTDIRAALTAHLMGMSDLPDVAWEKTTYIPTVGVPYLVPDILWAEPFQAEYGTNGANWESGIYQVRCVYPDGEGAGPLNETLGRIKDRFKRGTILEYNGLQVTIKKAYAGPNGIISIPFRCLAPN